MNYWERKEKLFKYIEGVRQFFPLATEQLDIISRIILKFNPSVNSFLDLGCGDGYLGYFIYKLFPDSRGVFLDVSKQMIEKAKEKDPGKKSEFIVQDFCDSSWYRTITTADKFDLIVSGFSIHHIDNEHKQRLYNEVYNLLNQNGIFLNLEHVASPSGTLEELFNDLFLDRMSDYHKSIEDNKSRDEIEKIYLDPNHKELNKLEPVELQCNWLRKIGFSEVDCYMKIFELALFGGVKK